MTFAGGIDTITLTVDPYDDTTAVTVTIDGPSEQTLTPTAVSTDGGQTWTVTPTYDEAGTWVAHWTITGTGEGTTHQTIHVSRIPSPAATVVWRPELWDVAAYVPRRTLVGAVDGYGNALDTFDQTTLPRGAVVWRLISDACAWVLLTTGAVDTTLADAAKACAAIRAAALVEAGYPDNRDDLTNADTLLKQAEQMRKDLAAANTALGVDDPATTADDLLPVWSFPAAPSYGDCDL